MILSLTFYLLFLLLLPSNSVPTQRALCVLFLPLCDEPIAHRSPMIDRPDRLVLLQAATLNNGGAVHEAPGGEEHDPTSQDQP